MSLIRNLQAQIILLVFTFALAWEYPVYSGWIYTLLVLSLGHVAYLLHSYGKVGSVWSFSSWSRRDWVVTGVFWLAPLGLAVVGAISWILAVYLGVIGLMALNGLRVPASRESVTPVAMTGLVLGWSFALILAIWPYAACRPILIPWEFGYAVAALHDLSAWCLSFDGLASQTMAQTLVLRNRLGDCVLSSGLNDRQVLLLSYETLNVFCLVLLAIGSLWGQFASCGRVIIGDFVVTTYKFVGTMYVHSLLLWNNVVNDRGSLPFSHAVLSLIVTISLWQVLTYMAVAWRPIVSPESLSPARFEIPKLRSWSALAVAVGLVAVGSLLFEDAGVRKPGRILIDESHSKWEKSDLPMNAEFFGIKSVYNYAFLKEILEKHFAEVSTNQQTLSAEVLNQYDVLILKTPTSPYSEREIEAIRDFVEQGGGLWAIGDHTNIFGMNAYLNQVCRAWGVEFLADSISPLPGYYERMVSLPGVPQLHPKCGQRGHELLFSDHLGNHPIIGNQLDCCCLLTSCSLKAPWWVRPVTISRGTYSDSAFFGPNTFFGDHSPNPNERYGCHLQNVAVRSGRGRIATWTDSTLFSNFSMCMSGVPDLGIRYVEWLNRKNSLSSSVVNKIRLGLIAFFVLTLLMAFREEPICLIYSGVIGVCGLAVMAMMAEQWNAFAYPQASVDLGFRSVAFDQRYSRLELPIKNHIHAEDPEVFESFYVLHQRLHLFPRPVEQLDKIGQAEAVVFANLMEPLDTVESQHLREFVASGKCLLLTVGRQPNGNFGESVDYTNRLLKDLGAGCRVQTLDSPMLADIQGRLSPDWMVENVGIQAELTELPVGATRLLETGRGHCVVASEPIGRGKVVVLSIAELLSNQSLNVPGASPDGEEASRLRIALRLITYMVDNSLDLKHQTEYEKPWLELLQSKAPENRP